MKRLAVALGVAAAGAGVAWWLREPAEVVPAASPERPRPVASAESAAPPLPAPLASLASRKLEELQAMSESVRNSTFVVAIRAAGFMCEDVVDVLAGTDVPAWRARCRDNHAYYLRVADAGDLEVEPTLDYFDSVGTPRTVEPDNRRPDRTTVPLEPTEPRR
jgi:hypothetical protein